MAWWLIVLGASLVLLGLSAIGLRARRRGRPNHAPVPQKRDTSPGAPPATPAPMARSAAPNWNAVGAITGVLGLIVSIIGLFRG